MTLADKDIGIDLDRRGHPNLPNAQYVWMGFGVFSVSLFLLFCVCVCGGGGGGGRYAPYSVSEELIILRIFF